MKRRQFLTTAAAAGSAALASPLARHVARAVAATTEANGTAAATAAATTPPAPVAKPRRQRHQRATVLLVAPPADWRPTSWRDVPTVAEGAAYHVVGTYGDESLGVWRAAVKRHNRQEMKEAAGGAVKVWAIVCCTDGRFTSGAGAESEVGA